MERLDEGTGVHEAPFSAERRLQGSARSSPRYAELAAPAGKDGYASGDRFEAPFSEDRCYRDGSRAARQRFSLYAALIGPHSPASLSELLDEVDVGAASQGRMHPQLASARDERHGIEITHCDNQMRHANSRKANALLPMS
jgi:hypothetical protein